MGDKTRKDIGKTGAAIIGIGFVLGILLLIFGSSGGKKEAVKAESIDEYRDVVERELVTLCENMLGERVEVFVSLESGYSYSYALDSRGGVMTVGSGSSENALVERVDMPRVSGVGVVYFGEHSPEIERNLLGLISSSLGIGTNKIFIMGAKKPPTQS